MLPLKPATFLSPVVAFSNKHSLGATKLGSNQCGPCHIWLPKSLAAVIYHIAQPLHGSMCIADAAVIMGALLPKHAAGATAGLHFVHGIRGLESGLVHCTTAAH